MDARCGPVYDQRIYDDFVPSHDLIQGDKADTIIINVPGFKKEHIKAQLDKFGKLKVSGERPVEENKWISFLKDFQITENCNTTEIRAKIEHGRLYITLPKLVVVPVPPPQDQTTQTNTEDKKASKPKLPSTDKNKHSKKANGEQREEKRSDPPLVDAQNRVEDDKADQSHKDSKSTSDAASEAESFKSAMSELIDQRKLSMRLRTLKQKVLKSTYGSRKTILCAFAVIVISVSVGMIMLQID